MNFRTLDLNLIRVLDALLQEHSTVRAGERLGLSQPAVSSALGRLRHALGDPIFIRRGKGMEPTDYALSLRQPLRETLDRLETLLSAAAVFDPWTATERFLLSGSDFFAEMLMPEFAARLARLAPGMRVQMVDLVPDNYIDTLERYEVDLALIPRAPFPGWVAARTVFRSSFSVVARTGHARLDRAGVAPGATVPLDLFCDLGHVLFSPEGNLRAMGDAALAAVGRERRVAMTLPVFSGVARAVSRSELIALIPTQYARRMAPVLGLEIYRPPMPVPKVEIAMIWRTHSTSSPAHRWFRDQVAEVLAPLDEGPD